MAEVFRSEVYSVALSGLVGRLVTITVTIQAGPPDVEFIGLAPSCVLGTKYRVLSALGRIGEYLDERRIAVSFSPAGLHNDGTFDLAIATGVLSALKQSPLARTVVLGELWPSGAVRAVRGGLPALLGVTDMLSAIVPWNNGPETSCLTHMELRVAGHLGDVADYLDGKRELGLARALPQPRRADVGDMADICGVTPGRRAAEIAAAGLHSLLVVGAPGSGKTTLSSCLPTVMPEMTQAEVLEVTSIYSVVGHLEEHERGLVLDRPFRSPHPKSGGAILVGRRSPLQPGEVSLAHHGVLFLENIQQVHARADPGVPSTPPRACIRSPGSSGTHVRVYDDRRSRRELSHDTRPRRQGPGATKAPFRARRGLRASKRPAQRRGPRTRGRAGSGRPADA
ncbi:ATP-binding protein [Polyangium aurulentum]|nr:ATP-binding protein [Polyangium aurulentum]UQA57032.1 ATP-binding protein [Polyangium aurulentum]